MWDQCYHVGFECYHVGSMLSCGGQMLSCGIKCYNVLLSCNVIMGHNITAPPPHFIFLKTSQTLFLLAIHSHIKRILTVPSLAKLIPRIRFQGSINVYKCGLWLAGMTTRFLAPKIVIKFQSQICKCLRRNRVIAPGCQATL